MKGFALKDSLFLVLSSQSTSKPFADHSVRGSKFDAEKVLVNKPKEYFLIGNLKSQLKDWKGSLDNEAFLYIDLD